MKRVGWLIWLLLAFAAIVVAVDVVSAHNCSSPADCEETPNYNTTIAVGGGAVAVTTAILTSTMGTGTETVVGEGTDEEEAGEDVDPCLDLQSAFDLARAEVMAKQKLLEMMRQWSNAQEVQYDNFKNSSFWNHTISVGFMGGGLASSAAGPALRGMKGAARWLGVEFAKDALAKRLAEAFTKSLGQTLATQMAAAMHKQGINWGDIAKKPVDSLYKSGLQEVLQDGLNAEYADSLLARGVKPDSKLFERATRMFNSNVAQQAGDLFNNALQLQGAIMGLWNMGSDFDKMSKWREMIHKVNLQIIDEEAALWDLKDAMYDAKAELDNCRDRVSMGLPVG